MIMSSVNNLADRVIDTDVLVIGSEGAGSRAAIEAAENCVEVTMVSKGKIAKSGVTIMAGADITLDGKSLHELGFTGDPQDSKDKFFRDIVVQGFYLNNQSLVEVYVSDAPNRVKELLDWGLKVYSSGKREINTTGIEIMRVLSREVRKHDIKILEDIMITDLLTKNNRVIGAVGIDIATGDFIVFKSKAVILATGGWHAAYSFNTGSEGLSGDGQAMAYRAGAELVNMEMVTFCPNVIIWPQIYRGSIFLYVLGMFCGTLLNRIGEKFLEKYNPDIVELATKTEWNKLLLSLFSTFEIRQRKGSPHGGVYFSLKDLTKDELEKSEASKLMPNWKFQGTHYVNLIEKMLSGELVEVGSAAHYFEGGIKINEKCETNLNGLYAAGECSGGLFGANRVAAATTEILVQGAVAGKYAAEYAKKMQSIDANLRQVKKFKEKIFAPLNREIGVKPIEVKRKIQHIAQQNMGVVRDGKSLKEALEQFQKIRQYQLPKICVTTKVKKYNKEWIEALELENTLQVLEISAKSALMRKESRGVHYRIDHPNVNNNSWLKEIVIEKRGERIHTKIYPITTTKIELPKGTMSFEDAIFNAIEKCK